MLVVLQIFYIFIDDIQTVTTILDMASDYKVTELFCIIDEFANILKLKMQGICWKTIAEPSAGDAQVRCQTAK